MTAKLAVLLALSAAVLAGVFAFPILMNVQLGFSQQPPVYGYSSNLMGMPSWILGRCPFMDEYGWQSPARPRLNIQQAVDVLQRYVAALGPNFKLHEVMEFQRNFYAIVIELDTGVGAFELLVNPYTGAVYPEPGPNMMWNTKYGMQAGRRGCYAMPTTEMPVTPEQAEQIALDYLVQMFGGNVEEEHPVMFYGYYTIDYKLNGRIHGMLSVNGYTGLVWYHWWHGQFIQEIEVED
ncbi:MAG: hypothetical protein QXJ73_06730 [Candidatus Caldarchaeum sp.]